MAPAMTTVRYLACYLVWQKYLVYNLVQNLMRAWWKLTAIQKALNLERKMGRKMDETMETS